MSFSARDLEIYFPEVDQVLKGRSLERSLLYLPGVYVFRLNGSDNQALFLSLLAPSPLLFIAEFPRLKSLNDPFFLKLEKELRRAHYQDGEVLENERIVRLNFTIIGEALQLEKRSLFLELIPHHPNLIITDEKEKIIAVYRPSSIEEPRPLMPNLQYQKPMFKGQRNVEARYVPHSFETNMREEILKTLEKKRRDYLFMPLLKSLHNRARLLSRKEESLKRDYLISSEALNDYKKGTLLLTYQNEIQLSEKVVLEGEEIALNPKKSIFQNSEAYFQKAKKAKKALPLIQEHLEKTQEEQKHLQEMLVTISLADEKDLEELLPSLKNEKKVKALPTSLKEARLPYICKWNGFTFLFGKNAKQNETLTFLLLKNRNYPWFHVANTSGAHVAILSDKPSEKALRIACSLALISIKQEDGDVIYALKKNLQKGHKTGEVKVLTHETIHIRKLEEEAMSLYKEAEKIEKL